MERVPYFDLFGSRYAGGSAYLSVNADKELPVVKILEIITREALVTISYNVEKGEYLWDKASERSILDVLSKRFYQDWWCGYPLFVHSDYKALLARRINFIIDRTAKEEQYSPDLTTFMKGSLEAWKEQLGCVWDESKKQFIV